jgi:multidrug efflux system outer membrane protein
VNWEIDFWGKYRRATEGAKADLLANEFNRRTVQISLISDVSASYFTLLDYKWRLAISHSTIALREENVDIIRQKFNAGLVPEIDLNNAQLQYAIALSAEPQFERLIALEETKMSVLLGMNPKLILTGDSLDQQNLPPEIPVGLPSTLLLRRPDVAYSEAKYHAQMTQIGVAQAQRFPSIGLTGVLGAGTSALTGVAGGFAWNAGANIAGPIFQFGKNKRRVEIEKARTEQSKLQYEKTVIQAFKEVEDALISVSTYKKELSARELQTKSALNAQMLSQLRYDKGVTSYLEVITLQGYAFDAELSLAGTRRSLFESYIKLYKALGGGWISKEEKKTAEENSQEPNELPKLPPQNEQK